jgi:hypothetical protein
MPRRPHLPACSALLSLLLAVPHTSHAQLPPAAPQASAPINWGRGLASPVPAVLPRAVPGAAPPAMPLAAPQPVPSTLPSSMPPAPPRATTLPPPPSPAPLQPPAALTTQPPGQGAHSLAQGSPRELKTPADLVNLNDTQPVRFEGRTTTLKALREASTTQVLRQGSAGITQATWSHSVRGQPLTGMSPSPTGALAAANSALRRSVEGAGPVADTLLRPSGGAITTQRCNGVDYTFRAQPNAAPLTGPQLLNLKQSHIGPGGAVVLNGLCFGATPGRVRLIGNFPGGQLMLSTPVWRHDVVYAEIPPLNGVASHPVVVQLLDARGVISNEMPGTWDAPPQVLEVDSARVWEITQCDVNRPPFDAVCRSGAQLIQSFETQPLFQMLLDQPKRWLAESLPASAIGALHRRVDLDKPVEPFQGRDVYRLRAPAGCVAEKTFWSAPDNAPATGFTATHLDERTVAVDWRADYCVKYGWALDHDWSCVGSYMSRKTVISCPAGTALP